MSSQSTHLTTILNLIPKLNLKEQLEVKKRLDFLIGDKEIKNHEDWLTAGICYVLEREGLMRKGLDWRRFAPSYYKRDNAASMIYLADAARRPLSPLEKLALGRVVAEALFNYLSRTPGFGLKVMLQGINRIPQALDASYPGYVASGMLSRLIKVK